MLINYVGDELLFPKETFDQLLSSVTGRAVNRSWFDSVWSNGSPVVFEDQPAYRYTAVIAGEGFVAYAKRVVEQFNDCLNELDITTASHVRLHPYNGGWKLEVYLHRM